MAPLGVQGEASVLAACLGHGCLCTSCLWIGRKWASLFVSHTPSESCSGLGVPAVGGEVITLTTAISDKVTSYFQALILTIALVTWA